MVAPAAAEHPFEFTSHPPERGRSETSDPACAGACCSCCCCCLHTMGGLVGALAYSLRDPSRRDALNQEELDYQDEFASEDSDERPQRSRASDKGLPVGVIYWLSLLVLSLMGLFLGLSIGMQDRGRDLQTNLLASGFVLLMVLPGVQFLAVGVTLVIVGLGGGRGESGAKFSQVARITIGTTVGAFVGLLIMVAACGGLILIR